MDEVIRAVAKKTTQWKKDIYFAVKVVCHKLFKNHPEVTQMIGMVLISVHILASCQNLRSFSRWGKGMHIYPEDEISYAI
jgi:hypothetical protein